LDGVCRWYACHTRSRCERRVEERLSERGIEAWVPTVARERARAGRRKVVRFPLFPSYVFARFGSSGYHRVLNTPGIATVVRHNGRLAAIRDDEIDNIRRLAAGLEATDQHHAPQPLRKGEWVRVASGPFEGVEGVVIQLRGRVHVLAGIRTLGQGIPVFLDSARLERIPARGP
jgi:transcriptional antiterminator NusG